MKCMICAVSNHRPRHMSAFFLYGSFDSIFSFVLWRCCAGLVMLRHKKNTGLGLKKDPFG